MVKPGGHNHCSVVSKSITWNDHTLVLYGGVSTNRERKIEYISSLLLAVQKFVMLVDKTVITYSSWSKFEIFARSQTSLNSEAKSYTDSMWVISFESHLPLILIEW